MVKNLKKKEVKQKIAGLFPNGCKYFFIAQWLKLELLVQISFTAYI